MRNRFLVLLALLSTKHVYASDAPGFDHLPQDMISHTYRFLPQSDWGHLASASTKANQGYHQALETHLEAYFEDGCLLRKFLKIEGQAVLVPEMFLSEDPNAMVTTDSKVWSSSGDRAPEELPVLVPRWYQEKNLSEAPAHFQQMFSNAMPDPLSIHALSRVQTYRTNPMLKHVKRVKIAPYNDDSCVEEDSVTTQEIRLSNAERSDSPVSFGMHPMYSSIADVTIADLVSEKISLDSLHLHFWDEDEDPDEYEQLCKTLLKHQPNARLKITYGGYQTLDARWNCEFSLDHLAQLVAPIPPQRLEIVIADQGFHFPRLNEKKIIKAVADKLGLIPKDMKLSWLLSVTTGARDALYNLSDNENPIHLYSKICQSDLIEQFYRHFGHNFYFHLEIGECSPGSFLYAANYLRQAKSSQNLSVDMCLSGSFSTLNDFIPNPGNGIVARAGHPMDSVDILCDALRVLPHLDLTLELAYAKEDFPTSALLNTVAAMIDQGTPTKLHLKVCSIRGDNHKGVEGQVKLYQSSVLQRFFPSGHLPSHVDLSVAYPKDYAGELLRIRPAVLIPAALPAVDRMNVDQGHSEIDVLPVFLGAGEAPGENFDAALPAAKRRKIH
ncbi:MAG: hypothetical protein ACK5O7_04840 [Holosporales bacterium]